MAEDSPDALSDDAVAGSWRLVQRVRGHRYSLDDVATAWEAARERPEARRVLDLGTGIGSVAIMLAYRLPQASLVGIEAQEVSFGLAETNVARNGLSSRIELVHGDLRRCDLRERAPGGFDLVTGTPPYFDPRAASPSTDAQRAYARLELRGGIEDYLRAGARALGAGGRLVVCGDARRPERVLDTALDAGLAPLARRDIVPRQGKGALFTIWVLGSPSAAVEPLEEREPLVARDAAGRRTEAADELRRFFGLTPGREPASPPTRARRAS